MGFLDIFDHPDVLSYLLGGAPTANNVPAPNPPAPPPAVASAAPTDMPADWTSFPNPGPRVDPNSGNINAPPLQAPPGPGTAQAAPSPVTTGGLPQRGTVPDVLAPVGPQIARGPQQGPIETEPPATPPPVPAGVPAPATQGGNFMRAFGLPPIRPANPLPTVSPWQNALAALGAGMSTIGGNTAGGAFARGFGGATLGGLRNNQIQQEDVRRAHNDLFNQSSIAYRDMLLGLARNDANMVSNARANWLNAGAQMRQMGGKDVFSGSPYAKSLKLENDLDRQDENARKQAYQQFMVDKNGSDVDGAIKRYNDAIASIAGTRNQRRNEQAKRRGIDPDGYLAGTDQEHAFDYDKLTPEQRLRMPENSIYKYKDKDGNTQYGTRDYDAKPPYPGYQRQQQQPQSQPPLAQTTDALYGGSGEGDYAAPTESEAA